MGMGSFEEKTLELLRQQTRSRRPGAWLAGGVLALLALAALGLALGLRFNLALLPLVPLALVALKAGRTQGYVLALVSAGLMAWVGLAAASVPVAPLEAAWNAATLAALFLGFVFLLSQLSARLVREQLARQVDELTGLMAPGPFQEHLATEIERSRRFKHAFSVVGVGCDNLRLVGTRLGRSAQDSLLRLMAEYLRATFRATDLIARLDEEEFVILLTNTDDPSAILAMEKLRARLNEGITQHYPEVTFSIGIVSFANCSYSARQVLDMVDMARSEARDGGGPAAQPAPATA